MTKLVMVLKSRTFIVLVIMCAFNIMEVLAPNLTPEIRMAVNGVLTAVAAYYHVNPSQPYGNPTPAQSPQAPQA